MTTPVCPVQNRCRKLTLLNHSFQFLSQPGDILFVCADRKNFDFIAFFFRSENHSEPHIKHNPTVF